MYIVKVDQGNGAVWLHSPLSDEEDDKMDEDISLIKSNSTCRSSLGQKFLDIIKLQAEEIDYEEIHR